MTITGSLFSLTEGPLRTGVKQLAGAHDVVSARLIEQAGFDGVWASSLGLSATYGRCDRDELSWQELADCAERIAESVSLPVLLDGIDGSGGPNVARQFAGRIARRGIAGLSLEDKAWPRRNSLDGRSELLEASAFAAKLKACRDAVEVEGFLLVARTDGFIAGEPSGDVIARAETYALAGADAVIVHSRHGDAEELSAFMQDWPGACPIIAIPTTYWQTPTSVFQGMGIAAIIWPNQLMRAAIEAMRRTAIDIRNGRVDARNPGGPDSLTDLLGLASCGWCSSPPAA